MAHSDMLAPASQLAGANLKDLQDLYDNVFLNSPDWEAAQIVLCAFLQNGTSMSNVRNQQRVILSPPKRTKDPP